MKLYPLALKIAHSPNTIRDNGPIHCSPHRFRGLNSVVLGRPEDWASPLLRGGIGAHHRRCWQDCFGVTIGLRAS